MKILLAICIGISLILAIASVHLHLDEIEKRSKDDE